MKLWILFIVATGFAPTFTRAAQEHPAATRNSAARQPTLANAGSAMGRDGRYWYHTADGQWFVWAPGHWVPAANQDNDTGPPSKTQIQGRTSRKSIYRRGVVSYPDDDTRNVYHGIDWYTNGRGPFSD